MKFLIYSILFGSRYDDIASIFLDCLYRLGEWDHDVAILTDSQIRSIRAYPRLSIIDISALVKARYPWLRYPLSHDECCNLKPEIRFHTRLEDYDYILYLDIDILVTSPRLKQTIITFAKDGFISVQRDKLHISDNKRCTGNYILTQEEKEKWGGEAICNGLVGFPGNRKGDELLEKWMTTNVQFRLRGHDQGNFIATLLRGFEDTWKYWEDAIVAMDWTKEFNKTIVHFTANQDTAIVQYYRNWLQSNVHQ